ncbi:helix-turn-helix domain-containing protein [Cohnella sp. CFH 77786]|uniref:AraC family transcriptional regulator n=1 Tax=Cohnella sp. CFH 77786 TaxID=2662265 RepID=UPI001C608B39|nr:AraC family transcriptional regulator [Cohnella sp. CFH 77786]MBW5447571.1 helix-turn-helix domain-containing protein [Cohnella sp. CFH 77786]
MDWVNRMNAAIHYIEDHLTEEIDYAELARLAGCSVYHFQRMFSFMTDISLSEYIRRRRLTLAAFELQNGAVKVVDLAMKCGYDSPEAFTRAFHGLHGATPTAARNAGTRLKTYPPLSFQFTLKGAAEMNYRMETLGAFSIAGIMETVETELAFRIVPEVWRKARERGVFEELWAVRRDGHPMGGILGVCADGDWGRNPSFDYYLAIVCGHEPPEGMVKMDFPEAAWAVFEASGPPEGLQEIWKRLYTEWLPASAYELANLPAVECYLPIEEGRNELWVPVVKTN